MYTDIRLDEVQNKLSAGCHAGSLNVLTNVRKGFKRKNIYPRGVAFWKHMGGVFWDENVTAVVGNEIGGVDYSAVIGGGGTSPSRGDGVRQGRAMPHRHATPTFTRTCLHAWHADDRCLHCTVVMHCALH